MPPNRCHLLRVDFRDAKIRVSLNGKVYIEGEDQRISGPGKVGVWTKSDSVTVFVDFVYEASKN